MPYTFLRTTLPGTVHGGGAELVDIDGSRIDYSLYARAASLRYVRKWCTLSKKCWFEIKTWNSLLLERNKLVFKFYFRLFITSGKKTKKEKYIKYNIFHHTT